MLCVLQLVREKADPAGGVANADSHREEVSVRRLPDWPARLCPALPTNRGLGFCVCLEKGKQSLPCLLTV